MKVEARTYWVWTEEAEAVDPNRIAGTKLPEHYSKLAPRDWLLRGHIVDSTQYEGQIDLYMAIEGGRHT